MANKTLFQSRTFWANLITLAAGILGMVAGSDLIKDYPKVTAAIVAAIGVLNIALRIVTVGPVSLTVLLLWLFAGTAMAQVQLLSPERERIYRSYIPKIDDVSVLNQKIAEATLYDATVMPRAHQFQPLPGGTGADYTVFYSQSSRLNNIDRYTNGNEEAPWKDTGGLAHCDRTRTFEFGFFWLPPDGLGGVWPIVVWRGAMDPSNSVNMPTPTRGWKWIYPAGTIVGEVLLKKFADGSWACYEVRMRLRELDDWDIEKEVPFRSLAELRKASGQSIEARAETLQYDDDKHAIKAFDITGTVINLPPIQNARQLLRQATFRPDTGLMEHEASGFTANDDENIVPAKYLGGILTGRETCVNCHKHVQLHVDRFQNRDWYGHIGSGDGIFRLSPISLRSIGPPSKPVMLREEFVSAGMVEMYDPVKHPNTVYGIATKYDNTPKTGQKRQVNPNRMIVGGS